ncbi:MAG: DUF2905 domain-containing protein [Anaerolineales bacterium]
MDLESFGRLLFLLGAGIALLGLVLLGASQVPFLRGFGNLPGDIRIEGNGFTCFAPIVSMLLLSIILSVILNVIARIISR